MLPSAVRDPITRPMPSFERGRTNNIGEGRRSSSRSSSCNSSVSRRTVQRSPHPGSSDELDDSTTNTRHERESDVSIVRPPLGFGRFRQTGSAAGSFGSGSGFSSQHTQDQSITSNNLDGSSKDGSSSVPSVIPIQQTVTTALPTKVRPPSSKRRPAVRRSSHPLSPTAHTQSTASTILPTKIRISRGDGYLTETSTSHPSPQGPTITHDQSGVLPSKRRTANSLSGHASPLTGNRETGLGVQKATSFRSTNNVTPDAESTSPRHTKNIAVQDVYRQAPLTTAPVQPSQPSTNSTLPDDATVTETDLPPSEQSAPNPNPNGAQGGSVRNMPVSIHNFLTLPSIGYPSSTNSRSSTPANVTQVARTDKAVLPSAYQRQASVPVAEAKHPDAAKSNGFERNEDPQNSVQSGKKRDKAPGSQARKKRADWRVENYVNSSATAAPSNPSQAQFYYSGPHQPAFKASDPITTTTVLSGPDARSHFTKTSTRPKTLPWTHASDEPGHPNSSRNAPDRASASQFSHYPNAGSPDDGLDTSFPVDVDVPIPVPYRDHRSPSHESTHNSQLLSRSSASSEPRSTEQSLPALLTPTDDDHYHSAPMDPMESVDHQSTTITGSGQTCSTTKSSEKVPASRLVTVIIEDFRVEEDEPFLVEISVPLRTAEDNSFWADAVDVCDILQNGPSRIDGPAKVYTFRGRYRQYFLRVSAENADNYVPANLSVASDRFLRVFVEPTVPSVSRPASSIMSSTRTMFPQSSGGLEQLLSPAPSGSSEHHHNSLPVSPALHAPHSLKRNHDQLPSHRGPTASGFNPTARVSNKRRKEDSNHVQGPRLSSYS